MFSVVLLTEPRANLLVCINYILYEKATIQNLCLSIVILYSICMYVVIVITVVRSNGTYSSRQRDNYESNRQSYNAYCIISICNQ